MERAWAVLPTTIRANVERDGLQLAEGESVLYLFDTAGRAERFAASGLSLFTETPEGRVDVWEARVAGLPCELVPNEDGPSALVTGTVPPDGLRLVKTL